MTEDFVSFSIAKKLKEKGYPQHRSAYRSYFIGDNQPRKAVVGDVVYRTRNEGEEHLISCPSISQVLKWLREEKKIHILISTYHHTPFNVHDWGYDIINLKTYNVEHYDYGHNSYEAAAIAGIEYVIENLI